MRYTIEHSAMAAGTYLGTLTDVTKVASKFGGDSFRFTFSFPSARLDEQRFVQRDQSLPLDYNEKPFQTPAQFVGYGNLAGRGVERLWRILEGLGWPKEEGEFVLDVANDGKAVIPTAVAQARFIVVVDFTGIGTDKLGLVSVAKHTATNGTKKHTKKEKP